MTHCHSSLTAHLIRSLSLQLGSQAQSLLSTSWPRLRLDRLGPSRMRENNLLHNEIQRNQTHKYRHMPEVHANLKRTNSGIPLLDLITDSQDSVVLPSRAAQGKRPICQQEMMPFNQEHPTYHNS